MDRFLTRTSSNPNLGSKRPLDDVTAAVEQWREPKKFASSRTAKQKENSTATKNRYSGLPVDDPAAESFKKASQKMQSNQIPPILIELLGDWSSKNIKSTIEKYEKGFHLQYRGRNTVKVQCFTAKGHQLIKDGLLKENVVFHTYSRKDEKLPKAVIKGLPKCLHDEIPKELASMGFSNVTIVEMKTFYATECPPLLVQLPSGSDMGKFKQIRYLFNCVVSIHKYKPTNKIGTQCYRCQGFGHGSKNCNRPARCVKCALEHPTWECPKKNRDEPARCCNCDADHPANYSKCPEKIKYMERIQSKRELLREAISKKKVTNISSNLLRTDSSWPLPASASKSKGPVPPQLGTNNASRELLDNTTLPSARDCSHPNRAELVHHNHIGKAYTQDLAMTEMLEILNTIKTIKSEFINCNSFMEKVILILTHLGHYV